MASGDELITIKDYESGKYRDLFLTLEQNNASLFHFIVDGMKQKDMLRGLDSDMLRFLAKNTGSLTGNSKFSFFIVRLISSYKISPDIMKILTDYFSSSESTIDSDDFYTLFTNAIDQALPFDVLRNAFAPGTNKEKILKALTIADDSDADDKSGAVSSDSQVDKEADTESSADGRSQDAEPSGGHSDIEPVSGSSVSDGRDTNHYSPDLGKADPGYVSMFNSLITAMSLKNTDNSVNSAQKDMSGIIAKFQLATSEIMTFSSQLFHEMEDDKMEIRRLNSVLVLQNKVMAGQLTRISELRDEIIDLRARISEAEKSEIRRKEIDQKIAELQNMTLSQDSDYISS